MIWSRPGIAEPLDQGDVVDQCPVVEIDNFDPESPAETSVRCTPSRVLVLTQTCDVANQKTTRISVAVVHGVRGLVESKKVRAADVRGPIRAGRVFGWYFLPKCDACGLEESIVDLRHVVSVPRSVLDRLIVGGQRRARLQSLYREHLARHFAETFARIGLPEPYETEIEDRS